MGPYFLERLEELQALDMVGDVRGTHLMACVEFVKDKITGETLPEEMDIGKLVSNEAGRLGLIVRPMVNLNVMSPSLICTERDIDFIVDRLRQAIEVTSLKLRCQGVWKQLLAFSTDTKVDAEKTMKIFGKMIWIMPAGNWSAAITTRPGAL